MERNAADQLDVIMPLTERTDGGLAHGRESFGEDIVELLAVREALSEQGGLAAKLVIAQRLHVGLERIHRVHIFAKAADIAVIGRSEDALCQSGDHGVPLKTRALKRQENLSPTLWEIVAGDVRSALAVVN